MGGSEEKGEKEKRGEQEREKKEGGKEGKHKMYDGVAYFH